MPPPRDRGGVPYSVPATERTRPRPMTITEAWDALATSAAEIADVRRKRVAKHLARSATTI